MNSAIDIIRKKRDGGILSSGDIEKFVHGATTGAWADYQLGAMLMAIFLQGMNATETAVLTRSMVASGQTLDLSDIPGFMVDKHSTGGVGDKTSLILAPLAAACGCSVPMMSGRGLGHSGGTLDKLESIPGFRVDLSMTELRASLKNAGCVLIGQTSEVAPADKKLYPLRDVTATVESIPLITASIMSKKIAEGIRGLVLDVKCGRGAFMKTSGDAHALARSLVSTGAANGLKTIAFMTAMDQPLGFSVGNALEVIESIETLKGHGPHDLEELSVLFAAEMLHLAQPALTIAEAEAKVRSALTSGAGLEKLRAIIDAQGGDSRVIDDYTLLPSAPREHTVDAPSAGFVSRVDAEQIGQAAMMLGAGRATVDDGIDPSVGIVLKSKIGFPVSRGDKLAVIHYQDASLLQLALPLITSAFQISAEKPEPSPLVLEKVVE